MRGGPKKPAPRKQPSPQHENTPVVPPATTPAGGQEGYLAFLLDTLFNQGLDLENRVITIEGEIEEGYFSYLDSAMSALELTDSETPITIRLSTPGGSVYSGWAMVARIESSPCDVIVEGFGAVMSMGTILLAAGDKRRISRHASFMYHCSSYGVSDRHTQIKHLVKQGEKDELHTARYMSERSKKPVAFWKKLGADVDAYLTPEELLEIGIIDEIF
jgi:ATP-dependent Clp protease protease subunit